MNQHEKLDIKTTTYRKSKVQHYGKLEETIRFGFFGDEDYYISIGSRPTPF